MEESETDDTLACSNVLRWARARLCVDLDVLIKVDEVLDTCIMAILLDDCVDDELCCSSCVVVTCPDKSLVLRVCQICEILWDIDTETSNFILVVHDSEDTSVNTEPSVFSVFVNTLCDVLCVFSSIRL